VANFCDRAEKCVYDPNCPNYLNCEKIPPDEDETLYLPEKVAAALVAIKLVTWLVRPGNRTAEMIREYDKSVRESIARAVGVPPEK
jgi:hypothetical protein